MYQQFLKKTGFIVTTILLLISIGCSGAKNTGSATPSKLAKLDLLNASNLFIAPGRSNTSATIDKSQGMSDSQNTLTSNKLFKITTDGYVQEVNYFDANGTTTTVTNSPTKIYEVDSNYVIICFGFDGYLVRKIDGVVFSLDAVGIPYKGNNGFVNDSIVKTDSSGNIYYLVQNVLVKINVADPNNLIKTLYSPDTDVIDNFIITANCHAAYAYPQNTILSGRVRMSNGGLYNLGSDYILWIGLDGKIKNMGFANTNIRTVTIDSSFNVTISTITGSLEPIYEYSSYLIKFPTRTLIVGPSSIVEVENPSNTPRTLNIPQFKTRRFAGYSSNYYYVSGTDVNDNSILLKIDPSDDSIVTLLPAGRYDIYKMTVSINNIVTFNALRMSYGAKIIGEIDSSGVVKILDETLNSEVVVLERIN
jgi:hypothetical protein